MIITIKQCKCGLCNYACAIWQQSGELYEVDVIVNSYTLYRSLMAVGKKEFFSLVVLDFTLMCSLGVFKATHPLYFKLPDVQCPMRRTPLPHTHYHLLRVVCVESEVAVLTSWHQTGHLPPVGCFIPTSDASCQCSVIRKLKDDVVLVGGDTIIGEQGVEDGAEDEYQCV